MEAKSESRGLVSVIIPSLEGRMPRGVPDDPRLEVIVIKGVSPVSAARNEGLAQATGEYVAWVDDDDEVTDGWLTEILKALKEDPDIVTFNVRAEWVDSSGRPPYSLDGRFAGQLWCKVFRRSLFDGLRFHGAVHEDWRIQCEMPQKIRRVHIDQELYIYRRSAVGLSQHREIWSELEALWGLLRICNSGKMFLGICERVWDLAKTPLRRLRKGG